MTHKVVSEMTLEECDLAIALLKDESGNPLFPWARSEESLRGYHQHNVCVQDGKERWPDWDNCKGRGWMPAVTTDALLDALPGMEIEFYLPSGVRGDDIEFGCKVITEDGLPFIGWATDRKLAFRRAVLMAKGSREDADG